MVRNTENKRLSKFLDKMIGGTGMAKKIERAKELLDNFNATNNGVIYIKENQLIGGAKNAANKNPLNTCAIVGYSENPISICSDKLIVYDFNLLKNYINDISPADEKIVFNLARSLGYGDVTSNLKIDDILINYYLKYDKLPGVEQKFSGINTQILGPDLERYIISNNKKKEIVTNTLRYDNHGKFELSKLLEAGNKDTYTAIVNGRFQYDYKHEGKNAWVQDFSHNGYNKDIVQAYEKNFIDNIRFLPQFIEEQYDHISRMTITDKIVINDYTKKSCFHFYLAYASKLISEEGLEEIMKKDGNWITGYKIDEWYDDPYNTTPQLYGFGDSFFKQILEVIGINRFNSKIITELKHNEYDQANVTTIKDYWKFLIENNIERVGPNDISIFEKELTRKEWDKVMRKFITDIDEIIAKAPPTKSVIYCYRAVSFDYIDLHLRDDILNISGPEIYRINEGTYINTRIGSLSLNYDSSVRYLKTNEKTKRKTGTMYRAYIMDGVKVLYIPSLSYASDEFEILHGSYGIFVDKKENYKCYNNKKNKYGILSYEDDQFNSAIVGLAGYSKNIKSEKFDVIADTLQELFDSVRKRPEPPETSENTANTKKSLQKIYEKFKASINKSDAAANAQIKEFNGDSKVDLVENNADTLKDDVEAIKRYYEAIRKAREAAQVIGGVAKKGVAKRGAAKTNIKRIF